MLIADCFYDHLLDQLLHHRPYCHLLNLLMVDKLEMLLMSFRFFIQIDCFLELRFLYIIYGLINTNMSFIQ